MKMIKCVYYLEKYCENVHTTQHNLQIQCNPYQNTNEVFHKARTKLNCPGNHKAILTQIKTPEQND